MLLSEKMKRLYMILRWYDGNALWLKSTNQEVSDMDIKLMLELEQDMLEVQKKTTAVRKKRKPR